MRQEVPRGGGWGGNHLIKYPEDFVRSESKEEVLAAQGFPNIQHHFFSFPGPGQGSCLSTHLFSQPRLHALKHPFLSCLCIPQLLFQLQQTWKRKMVRTFSLRDNLYFFFPRAKELRTLSRMKPRNKLF